MSNCSARSWLALAAVVALSCGGRQQADDRGLAAFEDAQEIHRRADQDTRRTREALFDQARDKYGQACREGHREACLIHDQLNSALRERRGECDSADECFGQAQGWLPSVRGERRLHQLCMGEQVEVEAASAPPAWDPHGPSCKILGDFYRSGGRPRHAAYVYRRGCEEARHAPACRGEALRVLGNGDVLDLDHGAPGRGDVLRLAEPHAQRGCELGGAASCALHARIALARHRVLFPDVHSLRYSLEEADPKALILLAKASAARGCEGGDSVACEAAERCDAELERVTGLLESGCVFLKNCGRGQVCNASTGRCEGRAAKGGFYAAYEKGISLFDARNYGAADKAFERARRMAPHLPGPWRWLGLTALRQRRYADCAAATAEALRLNPRSKHAAAMEAILAYCESAVHR